MATLCLAFQEIVRRISKVTIPFYIPTHVEIALHVSGFQFLRATHFSELVVYLQPNASWATLAQTEDSCDKAAGSNLQVDLSVVWESPRSQCQGKNLSASGLFERSEQLLRVKEVKQRREQVSREITTEGT